MPTVHWHGSIENILLYGISAIIVIDVLGLVAAKATERPGTVGQFGRALGAVIPFKG
jgi:hypothetical protein